MWKLPTVNILPLSLGTVEIYALSVNAENFSSDNKNHHFGFNGMSQKVAHTFLHKIPSVTNCLYAPKEIHQHCLVLYMYTITLGFTLVQRYN